VGTAPHPESSGRTAATTSPSKTATPRLARALVGLEEIRHASPRLAVAASGGTLLQRIARLLPSASPADGASRWVAVVLAVLALATFGAASRAPAPAIASDLGPGVVVEPIPAIAGERVETGSVSPKVAGVRGGIPGGVKGGVGRTSPEESPAESGPPSPARPRRLRRIRVPNPAARCPPTS
jgi:hypothetical protein